jgi:hypothetical protein
MSYGPPARTAIFFANEAIIDRRERRITVLAETTRFFGVRCGWRSAISARPVSRANACFSRLTGAVQ